MVSSLSIVGASWQEFHGRADLRADIACNGTDGPHDRLERRVIDVTAVPREQLVDAVHRRNGHVQGINLGGGRDPPVRDQLGGKVLDLPVYV